MNSEPTSLARPLGVQTNYFFEHGPFYQDKLIVFGRGKKPSSQKGGGIERIPQLESIEALKDTTGPTQKSADWRIPFFVGREFWMYPLRNYQTPIFKILRCLALRNSDLY